MTPYTNAAGRTAGSRGEPVRDMMGYFVKRYLLYKFEYATIYPGHYVIYFELSYCVTQQIQFLEISGIYLINESFAYR